MSDSFEQLCKVLAKLPGFGKKSAERAALHLAFAKTDADNLLSALSLVRERITPCPECCGVSEDGKLCAICADNARGREVLCLVESAGDLAAIEKTGAWRGRYHVLGAKLSPIKNIGPDALNLTALESRLERGEIKEIILALSNDIEGEATCHYICAKYADIYDVKFTRIGFGLPSGSQLGFADTSTIKSALDARKNF